MAEGGLSSLRKWALYRQPNFWLALFNAFYIAVSIVILSIGFVVIYEAKDDFNKNVALPLQTSEPAPCGLPTPDMIHLMQSLGTHEHGFGLPQLLEPDYGRWERQVQGSLCARQNWWQSTGTSTSTLQLYYTLLYYTSTSPPPPPTILCENTCTDATSEKYSYSSSNNGFCDDGGDGSVNSDCELGTDCDDCGDRTPLPSPSPPPPLPILVESNENVARELHALSLLSDREQYDPSSTFVSGANSVDALFDDELCREKSSEEGDVLYPHRLRSAFGDLKIRIARAYVAAAPAFYVYAQSKDAVTGVSCLGDNDPFTTECSNADHITEVLVEAGGADALTKMVAGAVHTGLPSHRTMLYALLALSLIGHIDRNNGGVCFKNGLDAPDNTAQKFCESVIPLATFTPPTSRDLPVTCESATYYTIAPTTDDTTYYVCQNTRIAVGNGCGVTVSPPPPAPDWERDQNTLGSTPTLHDATIATCRNMLQYGLFDQTRLFGLPDIIEPFQVNVRPTALSFLSYAVYSLFINPAKKTAFKDPIFRLELFLGYRLWALTIWGMMIASVTGYFFARSVLPMGVQIATLVFSFKNKNGVTLTLTRPKQDGALLFAISIAVLTGVYTLWVDPSTQAPYPTSSSCSDWIDKSIHSGSGAYLTSWGKRRFNRSSENLLGATLLIISILPFLYWLSSGFDARREKRQKDGRWVKRHTGAFWCYALCIFLIQMCAAVQVGVSADSWMVDAKNSGDTSDSNSEVSRDCIAAVMFAFWGSAGAAWTRSQWVVGRADSMVLVWSWAGGALGIHWIGFISYFELLPDEISGALETPSTDSTRRILVVLKLALLIACSSIALFMLRTLFKGTPSSTDQDATIDEGKENVKAAIEKSKSRRSVWSRIMNRRAKTQSENLPFFGPLQSTNPNANAGLALDGFKFDLSNLQLGYAQKFDGRRTKDQIAYLPMLPLSH